MAHEEAIQRREEAEKLIKELRKENIAYSADQEEALKALPDVWETIQSLRGPRAASAKRQVLLKTYCFG